MRMLMFEEKGLLIQPGFTNAVPQISKPVGVYLFRCQMTDPWVFDDVQRCRKAMMLQISLFTLDPWQSATWPSHRAAA